MSETDDEARAIESFHRVLHHMPAGGMHGEIEMSHDCDGMWIDDHGWDRIPVALLAAGWRLPPVPDSAPEDPESAEETLIARDRARHPDDTGGDSQGGDRLTQWIAEQHEEGQ